jgi:hypothetical protein
MPPEDMQSARFMSCLEGLEPGEEHDMDIGSSDGAAAIIGVTVWPERKKGFLFIRRECEKSAQKNFTGKIAMPNKNDPGRYIYQYPDRYGIPPEAGDAPIYGLPTDSCG